MTRLSTVSCQTDAPQVAQAVHDPEQVYSATTQLRETLQCSYCKAFLYKPFTMLQCCVYNCNNRSDNKNLSLFFKIRSNEMFGLKL